MTIPSEPHYGSPLYDLGPISPRSKTARLVADGLRAQGLDEAADLVDAQAREIERLRARLEGRQ